MFRGQGRVAVLIELFSERLLDLFPTRMHRRPSATPTTWSA